VPGGNLSVSGGTAVAVVVASGQCSRHCLLIMSACSNLAASRQATRVQGSVTTGARAIAARTWLNQAANSFGSRLSASSQSCAAQRARARFSSRFSSRIQCGSHNSRHAHILPPHSPSEQAGAPCGGKQHTRFWLKHSRSTLNLPSTPHGSPARRPTLPAGAP